MNLKDLKHAQRERLVFLDKEFVWKGRAKRKNLIDEFGISTPQAALDFKVYLSHLPKNALRYDTSLKAYFVASKYQPLFSEQSLKPAQSLITQRLDREQGSLPSLRRQADPYILARLSRAMSNDEILSLRYISMSSGDEDIQRIAPTCFASDGERLHFRAFSFKRNDYRDYLPARIREIDEDESSSLNNSLPKDEDWHKTSLIWLKPKASLSRAQKTAVEQEYDFVDGALCIPVRHALDFYTNIRWGLDLPSARLEREKTEIINIDIQDYLNAS